MNKVYILVLALCCALFSVAQTAQQAYVEPTEAATIDYQSWAAIPDGLQATWASRDIHYARHNVPELKATKDTTIYAWKGERVGLQALVYSKSATAPLAVECKDGKLTSEVGWLRYVLTDDYQHCGVHPIDLKAYTVADMLDPGVSLPIQPNEVRALWAAIEVPRNCSAGKHTVKVVIKDGLKQVEVLKVNVIVSQQKLPEAHDYSFHLDFWQQPYSVSRFYGVKPWSKEHLELLRPYMERLARMGQKVVSAILFYEPWGEQSNDKFDPMIETILKKDGTWAYDYTVFDKWVKLCEECGVDQQIDCFSMVPWDMSFRYFDEASNGYKTLVTKTSTPEYKELWTAFLRAFAQHLKEKGWYDKTCIAMDERGLNDMMNAYNVAQEAVPGIKMALAGNYHKELVPLLHDYCIDFTQTFPEEELASRRAKGQYSTVYTCCSAPYPNIFSNSQPCEGAFLPLFCMANDFDGYLHWSYINWTDDPMADSRFKLFAPGDTYFFYPGNRTSTRYERFLEGIQQYEKIRILRTSLQNCTTTNCLSTTSAKTADCKEKLNRLNELLKTISQGTGNDPSYTSSLVNEVEALLNSF